MSYNCDSSFRSLNMFGGRFSILLLPKSLGKQLQTCHTVFLKTSFIGRRVTLQQCHWGVGLNTKRRRSIFLAWGLNSQPPSCSVCALLLSSASTSVKPRGFRRGSEIKIDLSRSRNTYVYISLMQTLGK